MTLPPHDVNMQRKFEFKGFYPFSDNLDIEHHLITNCKVYSVEDINSLDRHVNCNSKFSVLHLNCCSLSNKFDNFCMFVSQMSNQPDIICLTESWFTCNDVYYSIPGYSFHNFPRMSGHRGGGIVMYIKQNIDVKLIALTYAPTTFEHAYLQLYIPSSNSNIHLLGIYRPPSTSKDEFLIELDELLQALPNSPNDHVLFAGDFNIDLLDKNHHSCTLIELLQSFNAYPTIFQPTHALMQAATLIDNIFANFATTLYSGVIAEQLSDHLPILAVFELPCINTLTTNGNVKSKRIVTNKGSEKVRADLLKADWSFITDFSEVEHDYNIFIDIIVNICNHRLPIKYIPDKSNARIDKPWITPGICKSCKNRNNLYKKC